MRSSLAQQLLDGSRKTLVFAFAAVLVLLALVDGWFFRQSLAEEEAKTLSSVLRVSQQYYLTGDLVSLRNYLSTMASMQTAAGTLLDPGGNTLWTQTADGAGPIHRSSSGELGLLRLSLTWDVTRSTVQHYRYFAYAIVLFLAFAMLYGYRQERVMKLRLSSLEDFKERLRQQAKQVAFALPPESTDEIADVQRWFQLISEQWRNESARAESAARAAAFSEIASQVSHDIRSPLAALQAVVASTESMPEEERLLLRDASSRIGDIANSLLDAGRVDVPAAQLLSGLVESLVSEKRRQYRGVALDFSPGEYGGFAVVAAAELKRALSNLVNNAVEALPSTGGRVRVVLAATRERISISVVDNGCGIAADVLPLLGQRGVSFGKANGNGLGLHHARAAAESWGGMLTIESALGTGTTVVMDLPRAVAPAWFVPALPLPSRAPVVILDDDAGIHRIWAGRLGASREAGSVVHFSTAKALAAWAASDVDPSALFLVDHELVGSGETGLALVERLGLARQSILVTSRFDDPVVLGECARLRLRVLPKNMAGVIPISSC